MGLQLKLSFVDIYKQDLHTKTLSALEMAKKLLDPHYNAYAYERTPLT